MNDKNLQKIINNITETASSLKDIKYEENKNLEYLEIGEYFFQCDDYQTLKKDYENSCVYEYVSFEDYIKHAYCSW